MALLATPNLFPGAPMANSTDGTPSPLPDEFAAALRRATNRTLIAIQSLRKAVREHVHTERSRGVALDEIDVDLRGMIAAAGDGDGRPDHSPERVEELTRQVLKWSEAFYSGDGQDGRHG